jgi:alkylation response protein AidB-like acyl-CoA dehydrogenase
MGTDGVVERARALAPLISEGRDHSEQHRCIRPDIVDACRRAGLLALQAPAEVGGPEATLVESFEAGQIVAHADPSVAWYMNNSGPLARLAAWIDPVHWEEIYGPAVGPFGWGASPTGRLEPSADGEGFVLTGSWPLMTGVLDAQWAAVMCRLREPDGSVAPKHAVLPTSVLEVNHVWDRAVAMRGTGSHEISVADHLVPPGLVVDPSREPPRIDRTLYRCPPIVMIMPVGAGMAVGLLRAAVEATADEVRDKVSSTFRERASDNVALLDLMAEAATTVEYLHHGIRAVFAAVWEHVERGEEPPRSLRAAAVASPWRAIDIARDLISRLYANSSRAAFFEGHLLERSLRDVHAMTYGWNTIRPTYHDVGRVAVGHDPLLPGF